MSTTRKPSAEAIAAKGWLPAHRWLLIRRTVQLAILATFLAGPWGGLWIVKGNLSSSLILGTVPLTDPLVLVQSLFAGHALAGTAILGGLLLAGFYGLIGGRTFCAFVCPLNMVTDAAHWLAERLNLPRGWQPDRQTRMWLLAGILVASWAGGMIAWELLNPISALHRGLIFGIGLGWILVAAVFAFDLLLSRRGWCGHLCPQGAFFGLLGTFGLMRIEASGRAACDDCGDCFQVCPEPHVITPALKLPGGQARALIRSVDCTNCGRCIDVCTKDVFRLTSRLGGSGSRPATPHAQRLRKAS